MFWVYVNCAVVVVLCALIVVAIVLIVKNKKKKATNAASKNEVGTDTVKPAETDEEKEILAVNDRFDVKKPVEKKEEPAEKKPEEKKPDVEPAVKKEKKKPVEKKAEEPALETPVKEKKKKAEVKEEIKEEKPEIKEEKAEVPEKVETEAEEEAAEDRKAKVAGKIEICNSEVGGFTYILRANNGQLLYESKTYRSTASCIEGAKGFVEAVKAGMFSVRVDKFNRYKFTLKSPTSSNIIYVGESFDNERACLSNIESVRRFAEVSDIVDNTDADFKVEFTPYVISDEIKDKVVNNNGIVGRWLIEQEEAGGKNSPYVFLLYANNGQLLYESRDYSSYSSCKNGLEKFRTAIQEGQFIIDPDKAGRFKFILRNVSKNSLMEYIGQSYATERACADGIDSIYRFALVSPTDNL